MKEQIGDRDIPLDRLLLGDPNAFRLLYDTYGPLLYGVILDILQDDLLANDILAKIFIQATKRINEYDPDKMRIFTWLSQIAREESINAVNLVGATKSTVGTNTIHPGLRGVIEEMDKVDQRFLELSYYRNYSVVEVAASMGISIELARNGVLQALKRLGQRIATANGRRRLDNPMQ